MDLGIRGKRALVCASSKGLGLACAWSLAREGVDVVMAARTAATLDAAAEAIRRETGATIVTVATDVTTEAGRQALLAACPEPDILV
ncbi:SDR family NAD(P)-dependent oxidoreductase, partial [Achromobacter sp.]